MNSGSWDDDMQALARSLSEEQVRNGANFVNRDVTAGRVDLVERNSWGILGELCFEKWCQQNGKRYEANYRKIASGEKLPDFMLFYEKFPIQTDVKTWRKPEFKHAFIENPTCSLYVFVRLDHSAKNWNLVGFERIQNVSEAGGWRYGKHFDSQYDTWMKVRGELSDPEEMIVKLDVPL